MSENSKKLSILGYKVYEVGEYTIGIRKNNKQEYYDMIIQHCNKNYSMREFLSNTIRNYGKNVDISIYGHSLLGKFVSISSSDSKLWNSDNYKKIFIFSNRIIICDKIYIYKNCYVTFDTEEHILILYKIEENKDSEPIDIVLHDIRHINSLAQINDTEYVVNGTYCINFKNGNIVDIIERIANKLNNRYYEYTDMLSRTVLYSKCAVFTGISTTSNDYSIVAYYYDEDKVVKFKTSETIERGELLSANYSDLEYLVNAEGKV